MRVRLIDITSGTFRRDVNAEFRRLLLDWVNIALEAVDPARCVAAALRGHPARPVAVLALGKAAAGMMRGAQQTLGDHIKHALLVGPKPSTLLPSSWKFLHGDHPLPGANSLAAGEAVTGWLHGLDSGLPLLALVSGGGSALMELPVAGMTLAHLERLNRWLIGSGMDIRCINAVRSRFSELKRGGLLRFAGEREITVLAISDVPGDDVVDIASGPFSPAPFIWPHVDLPGWLQRLHAELPMPVMNDPVSRADVRVIARNSDALDAIARAAEKAGLARIARGELSDSAADKGRMIAGQVIEAPPGVHLFGGETTVRLPERPGRGGRNQQLALAAAIGIAGRSDIRVLAFGTDGVDGNTEDAGALVDGGTVDRIRDAGLDPGACLAKADSNTALAAAGDVIHTGPTGTNVMDVLVALKTA